MPTPNLYWPVYLNLEKDFLKLADYIHFSDDQLNVYSIHIADLIIRCAIEIEAISKELYEVLGGNMSPVDDNGNPRDLYFDTDCLDLLEQKWLISKKEITVSAANFYLVNETNKVLTPLVKCNKRGKGKWKCAYQAVKHNRIKSLKKATIENLLYAMGALYILNLYYKDERIDIGRVYLSDHDFDNRAGSNIFSAGCCSATLLSMSSHMDDSCIGSELGDKLDKSIYIIKYTDKSFEEMHKDFCLDAEITEQRFLASPKVKQFLSEHPECSGKTVNEICMDAGGMDLLKQIICFQNTRSRKDVRMEAMLNKHSGIYPELFPLSKE
jgi:hypothetical protein